ncbi:MAG: HepT-like ribonuclease domain-containing protein, partial [Promethearchaeota archaeon]
DYLLDILSSIQEIRAFTKGMDFEGFEKDRKTVNAVIRSLEVMGEAVKKIPPEIKDKYPEIPWKYIAGMRDKLIHEYHGVDLEIVWEVIEREIPPIKPKFKKILDELNE